MVLLMNDHAVSFAPAEVIASASATHAQCQALAATPASDQHYEISSLCISFSGTPSAVEATLDYGGGATEKIQIPPAAMPPIAVNFVKRVRCATGAAPSLTVPDAGTGIKVTSTLRGNLVQS